MNKTNTVTKHVLVLMKDKSNYCCLYDNGFKVKEGSDLDIEEYKKNLIFPVSHIVKINTDRDLKNNPTPDCFYQ